MLSLTAWPCERLIHSKIKTSATIIKPLASTFKRPVDYTQSKKWHCQLEGTSMGKGNNNRSNKETKKPKKEKTKVAATANSGAGKPAVAISGKKV